MDQIVGSSSTFNLTDDVMTNLTLCLTFAIDDDESNETLTLMENNEVFTNDLSEFSVHTVSLSSSSSSSSSSSTQVITPTTVSSILIPKILISSSKSTKVNKVIYQYNLFYLLLGLLVFVGCFGNILVCLAICLERRLQNATNFFLLSLAIADLLVSILVMPMSIVNEVYGYWPFGRLTCNFWVTCDVLCCSSSIYHMCFISVGRYVGIKNPLHARQARLLVSRRAVLLKIVIVWLIAALITSPITILGVIDSSNIMPDPLVCSIDNKYFLIIGAFSAFYLPMMIMVNSYVLTVRLLRRKAKFCKNSTDPGKWPPSSRTSITEKSHGNQGDNGKYSDNQRCFKRDFDTRKIKTTFSFKTRSLHSISDDNDNNNFRRSSNQIGNKRPSPSGSILGGQFGTDIRCRISKYYNTQPMMIRTLGSSVQVRTEQKATQVLGLVFFLFIICWSPFFTRNLIEALFTNIQMPASLPTIFLWLGYFSSTINPVIYTIFNRNFRRAFRRIILCQTIKYRLQRSSQSFTPNQRIGGRRGIYNNSNQNSPNVNNNNNNNDNDNDDNDNDNVNDNPDSGNADNVNMDNINLNENSSDDCPNSIHGYVYSQGGLMINTRKPVDCNEYSDGGNHEPMDDQDNINKDYHDNVISKKKGKLFVSKICYHTSSNDEQSVEHDDNNDNHHHHHHVISSNSKYQSGDNNYSDSLNMRYWDYQRSHFKNRSDPLATLKCCSEV